MNSWNILSSPSMSIDLSQQFEITQWNIETAEQNKDFRIIGLNNQRTDTVTTRITRI